MEIGELICSLPTKDDIQAMVANLEETHRRDLLDVRELGHLTTRVESFGGDLGGGWADWDGCSRRGWSQKCN